jgi:hypothetical protein
VFGSQSGDVSLSISQTLLDICSFGRHAFLHEAHEGVEGPLTFFLGEALSSAVFDELTLNGLLVFSRLGSVALSALSFRGVASLSGFVFSSQGLEVSFSISQAGFAISSLSFAFCHEFHEGAEGPVAVFLRVALSSAYFHELSLGSLLFISWLGFVALSFSGVASLRGLLFSSQGLEVSFSINHTGFAISSLFHAFSHEFHEGAEGPVAVFL